MEFNEVHSDKRRTIFSNSELLNGKEYTFIKLNRGKAIGGCMHENDEYYSIISGLVRVKIGDVQYFASAGKGGVIYANEPHMFEALEDSIICEWGISAENKQDQRKDSEMLREVNNINESMYN